MGSLFRRDLFTPNRIVAAVVVCALPFLYFSFQYSTMAPEPGTQFDHVNRVFINTDMHSHTTESDGDRTAEAQLQLAKDVGLTHLWVTDHDLIRALHRTRELQAEAKRLDIVVGFGVEITVGWLKKEHHLLGYFPDSAWAQDALSPAMQSLQTACAKVKASRENRNNGLVTYLNALLGSHDGAIYFNSPQSAAAFKPLVVTEVAAWAKDNANLLEPSSLGRPHFSKYLAKERDIRKDLIFGPRAGDGVALVTADGAFFDEDKAGKTGTECEALMHSATLAKRGIAFEPLPIVEAIDMINKAGGRAVVAHLPTLGPTWATKFGPEIPKLKAAGLWGLEAYSSEIDEANHAIIHELAEQNGLQLTGGSDNHGTLKVYAQLGDVHRNGTPEYPQLETWSRGGTSRSDMLRGSHKRV